MQPRDGQGRTLRITETAEATPGHYQVEVAFESGARRLTATVPLAFDLAAHDRESIRWYLEDYLLFPLDPAPKIAADIEARMAAIGDDLCCAVFFANRDAKRIWDLAREELADTRVEIITDVRHAASIPWELIRDAESKTPLALEAQSFVRGHRMPTKLPRGAPDTSGGPIRILLVICRPRAGKDVPFRSVAAQLIKGLDHASREIVQLDVLRPPTFDVLARKLRDAKLRGQPYHVVHFDGHGAYLDEPKKNATRVLDGLNAHVFGGERKGAHGYLVFEHPEEVNREQGQLIDGPALGKLLFETDVPILVLNACRSAHADPPVAPEMTDEKGVERDPHDDVASFGSLAIEVMDKGVSGVVAMRYNVYVVTAAQFVANLYGALAAGLSLGEAVSRGRKQLADRPERTIAYEPVALQDWSVPVVYEAERLPLFPVPASSRAITLTLGGVEPSAIDGLPSPPDIGFFGRDETLLALDRAFDKHSVVLLHAYAGSGKSSAAVEFARWYARTGGVDGPVLWTSFQFRKPLSQVLNDIAKRFERELMQLPKPWDTLSDVDKRSVALQLLRQASVLWIWDNVEPVAGFPAGTASAWTAEEQKELVDFLRDARGTKAKFLLTSRRDEQKWLGELPARITVPTMPMVERVQLARALASKRGARLEVLADWRPLLAFTQGNPLTITVLVGQAFRDGMRTKAQVEAFLTMLRAGESAFDDDEKEGRSRSLGASLSYGFEQAFVEADRKILALLHLFQGFVNVDVLVEMGNRSDKWCLPELQEIAHDPCMALLERAADIGLLSVMGNGFFLIHPAVPWFFREMFDEHYPNDRLEEEGSDATSALRAFVEVMGELGNAYHMMYEHGRRDILDVLEAEVSNLLHAYSLARRHGWWCSVTSAMQGLSSFYRHMGRRSEWANIVSAVKDDFLDPENDRPLLGREEDWVIVSEYCVQIACEARKWTEAERLQQIKVRWVREQTDVFLGVPPESLTATQLNWIRTLAVSLGSLGNIQRGREQVECLSSYVEAAELALRVDDRVQAAVVAFNLGHAYQELPVVRDLAEAERCYRQSFAMYDEENCHDRAQCLNQLGGVAFARFREARIAELPEEKLVEYLNEALAYCCDALVLLPLDAVDDIANVNNSLGLIYGAVGDFDSAERHFQFAISYQEQAGFLYRAAQIRRNFAFALAGANRLPDARAYAHTALRNFETYGEHAADEIRKTRDLLISIDHALNRSQPK